MQILFITVAVLVFASSVLIKSLPQNTDHQKNSVVQSNIEVKSEVLNATDQSSPTPIPLAEPTIDNNNNNFIYPNSDLFSDNKYQTSDNPDVVTDWYKNKIRELNYNVKNFVSTSVNGEVENKLVGADSESEIEIIITKSANNNITYIEIN